MRKVGVAQAEVRRAARHQGDDRAVDAHLAHAEERLGDAQEDLAPSAESPSDVGWRERLAALPWKRISLVAAGLFAAAFLVITAIEVTAGESIASITGGSTKKAAPRSAASAAARTATRRRRTARSRRTTRRHRPGRRRASPPTRPLPRRRPASYRPPQPSPRLRRPRRRRPRLRRLRRPRTPRRQFQQADRTSLSRPPADLTQQLADQCVTEPLLVPRSVPARVPQRRVGSVHAQRQGDRERIRNTQPGTEVSIHRSQQLGELALSSTHHRVECGRHRRIGPGSSR